MTNKTNEKQFSWVKTTWYWVSFGGKLYYATSPGPAIAHTAPAAAKWVESHGIPYISTIVNCSLHLVAASADPIAYTISQAFSFGTPLCLGLANTAYKQLAGTDKFEYNCDFSSVNHILENGRLSNIVGAQNPILKDLIDLSEQIVITEVSSKAIVWAKTKINSESPNDSAESAKDTASSSTDDDSTSNTAESANDTASSNKSFLTNNAVYKNAEAAQQQFKYICDQAPTIAENCTPDWLASAANKMIDSTSKHSPDAIRVVANFAAKQFNDHFSFKDPSVLYRQQIFKAKQEDLVILLAGSIMSGTAGFASGLYQSYHAHQGLFQRHLANATQKLKHHQVKSPLTNNGSPALYAAAIHGEQLRLRKDPIYMPLFITKA